MKRTTVTQAKNHEIDWINSKYDEVNFAKSNVDNEFIVIAKVDNTGGGLGRLVKIDAKNIELGGIYVFPEFRGLGVAEDIVRNLCEKNPFGNTTIWCLPFDNLLKFYSRFGFKQYKSGEIPKEIIKKLDWCNTEGRYEKEVLLLYKE